MHEPRDSRFNLLIQLGAVMREFPELRLQEALSAGQIASKRWLIGALERLDLPLGTIFVLGGWLGILPAMLFESRAKFEKIRSFDSDPRCAPVADALNRSYVKEDWRFKASTADIRNVGYGQYRYLSKRYDGSEAELVDSPDTLINTVCEHLAFFPEWWNLVPAGKLVVLQSNDFFGHPEHCNCSRSLSEFAASAPMATLLLQAELSLPDYRRFMLIGYK